MDGCCTVVDKLAHLTIRVIWVLDLIVRQVLLPSERGCKKVKAKQNAFLDTNCKYGAFSVLLCASRFHWKLVFLLQVLKHLENNIECKAKGWFNNHLNYESIHFSSFLQEISSRRCFLFFHLAIWKAESVLFQMLLAW